VIKNDNVSMGEYILPKEVCQKSILNDAHAHRHFGYNRLKMPKLD
jgi:hypothetical protein